MAIADRIAGIFPLTPLQRGLVFHALSAPEADPYVVQVTARIEGDLGPQDFAQAWARVADQHAALRTGFVVKGQREPVQVAFEHVDVPVTTLDWRGLAPGEVEAAQARLLREDRARGFALNRPPLLRLTLARLEEQAWWVLLCHHHLILDGWSQPLVLADFFTALDAIRAGRIPAFPAPAPLGAYVGWLRAQDPAAARAFWRTRLTGWEPAELPRLPGTAEGTTLAVRQALDVRATQAIELLARAARVTPSTIFQAAWALVLARYLARDDVTFGVTVSGRTAPVPGIERMVGMLVNTLPLRLALPPDATVAAWLTDVQAEFRAVETHAEADLAELGTIAGATPDHPLFETLVAYENFPVALDAQPSASGLRVRDVRSYERTNLAVALVVVPGTMTSLRLQVDGSRLTAPLAQDMAAALVATLTRMVGQPTTSVASLLDGLALDALAGSSEGNTSRRPGGLRPLSRLDPGDSLTRRFARVVAVHAGRLALSGPDGALTYRELDAASDHLAAALRRAGVRPEDRVALCFGRSVHAVTAMLGVLKAAAAYVPLDPRYPDERIAATLRDCGAAAVLTGAGLAPRIAALGQHAVVLDVPGATEAAAAQPAAGGPGAADPASAAYVIYTSGSTGRPKGVVVTHANVLRLFDGAAGLFAFGPDDVWSVFHSFAFDFSVWEIWGALLHGARATIVAEDEARDPTAFHALLEREGVTILSQTPSAFGQLAVADTAAPNRLGALREVVFGGEALKPPALAGWLARHGAARPRLVNMYGITETTVHVTFRPMAATDTTLLASPIGRPMPQLDVLLLDAQGRPIPDGVAGEICVAGDGLARGYLGRPALTAERFVPHPQPVVPGERLYRSGDLARRLPDGSLEYLRRSDRQLKVRGYRIEPAEVEAALGAHPAVDAAVVTSYAKDGDRAGLCAYVVAGDRGALGADPAAALRTYLVSRLPAHLVPDAFVLLEALPLTVNGKLDAAALPDPHAARSRGAAAPEPPATEIEAILAATWAKALGLAAVGVTENYFALGGDSIRSIRIVSLAAEAGVRVSVRELLQHPTIRELAQALGNAAAAAAETAAEGRPFRLLAQEERALVPYEAVDAYPLARLQAGMLFHADPGERRGLYLDLHSFRLAMPVDEAAVRAAVAQTVAAAVPLRTGFVLGAGRRPLQFVLAHAELPVAWHDLRGRPREEQEAAVDAYVAGERGRPYAIERPPLARLAVHRLGEELLQLTVSIHHAILDGWSVALWEAELIERYFALRAGLPFPPSPPAPPYAEFVEAEQRAVDDPAARAFWTGRLADGPAPALARWPGAAAPDTAPAVRFGGETTRALVAQAAAAGVPLKAVLLGIVGAAAARAAGAARLPVGLVTNGRSERDGGDRALGLFLNTVPVVLEAHGTWRGLAHAALAEETAVHPMRRFPLQEMVRLNQGAAPFECSFNLVHFHGFRGLRDRFPMEVVASGGVEAVDIPFSFNFSLDPEDGGLGFQLLAADDVPATQRDWLTAAVARGVRAAAERLDRRAQVIEPAEVRAMIEAPNRTDAPVDPTPVHVRALAGLRQRAQACVLHDAGGQAWTGRALIALVDELGARLGTRVARGTPVLLWLPPGPGLVAAMLAVLRAGGAYVPLDVAAPAGRLADVLEALDALGSPPVIFADPAIAERIPAAWREHVVLASPASPSGASTNAGSFATAGVGADDLAYVIFTSGSTGRPKGVMISHGALANHMGWMAERFPLRTGDVVLQRTSPAFDAAGWEFWAPLLEGAVLACAPDSATKDPDVLLATLVSSGATVLQLVPTLLEAVLALPQPAGLRLRRLFCGGELLRADLAADARARLAPEVVNLYGPTEATIDATYAVAAGHGAGDGLASATVPIGRPIANMRAYVLDEQLEPVPAGTPGELYLAGLGVARGYAGQPALTAERFVPDPFGPAGGRLYRTGDLVRRDLQGALHFAGRVDRQVKLGGNRLELEEIEAVLARHPRVPRAAVELEQAVHRLIAYVEGAPDPALVAALRAWLGERLPAYAVPRHFAFVGDWPLLPSGKTDRARLPDVASTAAEPAGAERAAPSGEAEAAMAALWEAVLGRPGIGATDDFFGLGGDSILALQLATRARRAGFAVSPGDVFRHPTVRALCAASASRESVAAAVPPPLAEPVPVTPLQRWFFGLELAAPSHWNQALLLRCPKGIALAELRGRVAALAARHDALRLRFRPVEGGWTMHAGLPAAAVDARDVADELDVTLACQDAQHSLDVEHGPLFRARLLRHSGDSDDRLFVVAHHLIVDGVSWRLLIEELAALAAHEGVAEDQAPRPYPFTRWAAARNAQIPSPEGVAFWRDEAAQELADLPARVEEAPREGRTQSLTRTLDARTTGLLLGSARERLRAEMPELLLAALGRGLVPLVGVRETGVLLERHGREAVPGVDLSQTVGWFTVLHPVRVLAHDVLHDAVVAAKEAIRRVPDDGTDYLTLAAQGPSAAPRFPQVSLNYLGQFDATLGGALRPAPEHVGAGSDPANRRTTVLDVVALVQGGQLRLSASFDGRLFPEADAAGLLDEMVTALEDLAALPAAAARAAWSGSDVPGAGLSTEALRDLLARTPDVADIYPASPVERGLLFQTRLAAPGSGVYVQQVVAELEGALDPGRLRAAWHEVTARHEALRSSFVEFDEVALHLVHAHVEVALAYLDWSGLGASARDADWERLIAAERGAGFDPGRPPLSRLVLVVLGEERWRLLWTHHHLIMDGWSLPLVFADVLRAYRSPGTLGLGPRLAPIVRWRLATDARALLQRAAEELGDLREPSLLCAQSRGADAAATVRETELGAEIVRGLNRLARAAGATLASAVNAAFALVLARHLGTADVVHGVTVSGRAADLGSIEETVGLFIATLPLRTTLRGDRPLADLLRATQAHLGALNERAMLPLGELQARLGLGPLFDTIVVFENYPIDAERLRAEDGIPNVTAVTALEQNHYPLSLYVHPGADRLRLALHVDPSRISTERAERFVAALTEVLTGWAGDAARCVGDTALLGIDDQVQLLAQTAGPTRPLTSPIEARIAAQADAMPDAPALLADGRRLTYREVRLRADRLAGALAARGIGLEDRVAVMLPRGADLPVALLGVLRAGAAFVPLDPAFPPARLATILEDAAPQLVLVDGDVPPEVVSQAVEVATVSALLAEPSDAPLEAAPLDALAYVIFTSGSTGRPKGVAVSRGALANACAAFAARPGLGAGDVVAAVTTVSFDIALNELLLPWTVGAAIAILDRPDSANGVRLATRMEAVGATVLQSTPTTWRLLGAADWRGPAVRSWCGGEALPADLAASIVARSQEGWNLYGPTETTIWSAVGELGPGGPVDAGTAIDNTRLYVVDDDGELLPPELPGHLLIGGVGVARGYVGKPGLTAAAFVPDPFAGVPGAVAYRTGDLARWSPEGRLEILGRSDRQIKISGYRVEPADIEVALRAAPGVRDAACTVRALAGAPALVAFVVPSDDAEWAPETLRAHAYARLPGYMVPALFIPLPTLPLTANGKVDYAALPDHERAARGTAGEPVAPRSPVEHAVLLIWQEAFGRDDLGIADDFFELGGHSLLATQIHARLGRVFQGQVPLRELFDAPTVALLAERLAAHETRPGAVTRAAELFVRLKAMSPEERDALRRRARDGGTPVGA